MNNIIPPDKIFTSLRSNSVSIKETLRLTGNVSFFGSSLQGQQTIQYTTGSVYNGLTAYGLITASTGDKLDTEELGALIGTSSVIGQGFGTSVALSADGNTMAVGGCGFVDDDSQPLPEFSYANAAVWIYTRTNGTWSLEQGPISNIGSGSSVALSGDGNVLAIGSYGDTDDIRIYRRTGTTWTIIQHNTGIFGGSAVGIKVSLSGDGNTLLICSDNFWGGTMFYVYEYNSDDLVWYQYGPGIDPGFNQDGSDYYENSPGCISYDGSTIAVSAYAAFQNAGQTAIYIKNDDGDWVMQGSFLRTGGVADREGFSNALSGDGNILVTGAIQGSGFDGKAFYYTRTNGVWSTGTQLSISGLSVSHFGSSVSISGDGSVICVGGYYDGGGVGAVWTYYSDGSGGYNLDSKLRGTDESAYSFRGYASTISYNGKNMAFTGPIYANRGAVWVYIAPEITSDEVLPKTNNINYSDTFFTNVTMDTLEASTILVNEKISMFGTNPIGQQSAVSSINSIINILQLYGFASTDNYWNFAENTPLIGTNGSNPNPGMSALQGTSVALSFNGETAIVGGTNTNDLTSLGSVWIFIKVKGVWSQQIGPLWDDTLPGTAYQGASVSLSSDGNYAAVGGPSFGPDGSGADNGIGAAYIYFRTGNIWSAQSGPLIPPESTISNQCHIGRAVSLSNAGDVLLVSGENYLTGTDPFYLGGVWIYNRTGTTWDLVDGPILPTDLIEKFGWSAALSGDGLTFVVGDPDYVGTGAIWIYENTTPGTPGGWVKTAGPLTSPTSMENESNQGISVSINGDGTTVAVGSSVDYNNRGAVYVYYKSDATWELQAGPLVGSASTSTSAQGTSVSLSGDGNTLVVGGPGNNANAGAYWTFRRTGTNWAQIGTQVSLSTEDVVKFGYSVAISANGENVLTGAIDVGQTGAAYPSTLSDN